MHTPLMGKGGEGRGGEEGWGGGVTQVHTPLMGKGGEGRGGEERGGEGRRGYPSAHSSHGEERGGEGRRGKERRGYQSTHLCCHSSRETLSAKTLSYVRDTFLFNAYE